MNIEDSCRLFLCFTKHDVGGSFYCCSEGKIKGSEQLRFCLGGGAEILESEGGHLLLATCPSSQRQICANSFISLLPCPIFIMRFSTILRLTNNLHSTFTRNMRAGIAAFGRIGKESKNIIAHGRVKLNFAFYARSALP